MSEHLDCVWNKDLCILSTSEMQLSNFISLHCFQISWYLLYAAHSYILQKSWETERWKCLPPLIIENNSKRYLLILVGGFLRHNYVKCPSLVATSPLSFWWVVQCNGDILKLPDRNHESYFAYAYCIPTKVEFSQTQFSPND